MNSKTNRSILNKSISSQSNSNQPLSNGITHGLDTVIDIPFEFRNQCWFCGEPSNQSLRFPHAGHVVLSCPHPSLTVPSCVECQANGYRAKADNIWQVRASVKKALIIKYQNDLAIGLNWTQEELANSDFEGGNFEGFQRSAWFMYEVARDRVNFHAWKLSLAGVEIEEALDKESFNFDGVSYPSIDDAVMQYVKTFDLNKGLLIDALATLGIDRFADAVRFCRRQMGATPQENKLALKFLS